ncbi:hypothetical protein [Pectobacterium versatile]|uniref:hypothetical protein n=1 Tax=Pectobacterium versatile TaxID=2488639 RepID=UPI0015DF43CB|nr:hypothetical protein [Pectobacterium versatile]MBA0171230.1 hypothetical protein [Pectobacterium versatile]
MSPYKRGDSAMNRQHLEVVTCVEHAKTANQQAEAVLSMLLDSLPNTEMGCAEANLVAAVLSLVNSSSNYLTKATEVSNA